MSEVLLRRSPSRRVSSVAPAAPATPAITPAGVAGADEPGDFLRRSEPPRRKRRHPLVALARPLATALALTVVPLGAAAWVLTAPPFRLREVVIEGATARVPEDWARRSTAPLVGENLVRLSLPGVAARLQRNPWVGAVQVRKELPDRLHVALTERRPVALLRSGGRLFYADEDGRLIVPVESLEEARRAGLLEVRFAFTPSPGIGMPGGGVEGALEVAGDLGRVRPDWAAKLTRIDVLGEEDFLLHTEALRFPVVVTRGQVGPKARRLEEVLPELERRYPAIERVDLRFSRRIVVQPAVPDPSGAGTQI